MSWVHLRIQNRFSLGRYISGVLLYLPVKTPIKCKVGTGGDYLQRRPRKEEIITIDDLDKIS